MPFVEYLALALVAVSACVIYYLIRRYRLKQLKRKLDESQEELRQAATALRRMIGSEHYLSRAAFQEWKVAWSYLESLVLTCIGKSLRANIDNELNELASAFQNGDTLVRQRNEEFIQHELKTYRHFFDTVETYPLTENQRRAIITDEKHNLIVAGAGTGKTSSIIGKAGYILQRKLCRPDEILLVTFARKARNEMAKRVYAKLKRRLTVVTFHSLGKEIIAKVEKAQPSVSKLSADKLQLQQAILEFIQARSKDQTFLSKLNKYFAFHKTTYRSKFSFSSLGEYADFLRNNQVRSLKGDRVKSLEECEIANFLYLKDIDYIYEKDYEVKLASATHRQYRPDFYLPKYGIYLEHFGIDKNQMTAPFVSRGRYLREMDWKRRTHRENNTVLIETYSWQRQEGTMLEKLAENLASAEVELNELPPEQIFERINKLGLVHPFTVLLATFLNLFKSSGNSLSNLLERARKLPDFPRAEAFIDIFSEVYNDYENSLGEEIDFDDMINRAAAYLLEGKYRSKFQYILVDEFQDISHSRLKLLQALLNQHTSAKLFCVGDDWQSIYRFTGSDISIMTNFQQHFTPCERLDLDTTFRFDTKLCKFSSDFVLKNPNQLKKHLLSQVEASDPAVTLLWSEDTDDTINDILASIRPLKESDQHIFIIGRYNHQEPANFLQLKHRHPNFAIEYTTAHSSKGTQSDYVIVVGLTSADFAFPSQIEDDPLLNLVLAEREQIPNAEERRLFYVAVTRARKHVYLIASPENPSMFASEVESGGYEVITKGHRGEGGIRCSHCKTGVITQRFGEFGRFYSCSNYPVCEYKPRLCPNCDEGFLYEKPAQDEFAVHYICSSVTCSFKRAKCPRCENGYLVMRRGRYSRFLGCSNYPACAYTRSLP